MSEIKLVSWNVNGLRAALKKDFMLSFKKLAADVFSLQETKMQPEQAILDLPGYRQYWNSAEKKGYSGTAVFSRLEPLEVKYDLGIEPHDHEGRVILLEFEAFYLVNVYTPNSQRELTRLAYRMEWEDDFRKFLQELDKVKPVVLCGDLNVAHREIDLKNPRTNHRNAGFTDEERGKFDELLAAGFADTFREMYPDRTGAYTWWSYLRKARETNAGWRIDYFVVSRRLMPCVKVAAIHPEIFGSDHCPVELVLNV
jgi:exodeoxyribonuclease-3